MTNAPFVLERNRARADEVGAHLRACDTSFMPPLGERVDLDAYASKIVAQAERFEAREGDSLAGLVAAYCNDPARRTAFITSVSVLPSRQGHGLASRLLRECIAHVRLMGFERVELEVDTRNVPAARLYLKVGFELAGTDDRSQRLRLTV
jgi:ribosomal protein S18 acetylase RimI-like enzyme